ncbi:Uncharacterized protein APZ42_003108 [Daphnia magna]|uniref:Uncharacterized protein n=1 Tax=Daphnia magna TaxID=35525 RepID=A0A164HTQ9_9CRUS|nr:Uncharacterized protein APZ42_003108 [Daphnia magna]
MPDDHSKLVPLLPIPNRTVKRLRADDSAHSRVKVGHRQASTSEKRPVYGLGVFFSSSCLESGALMCQDIKIWLQSLEQTSESA